MQSTIDNPETQIAQTEKMSHMELSKTLTKNLQLKPRSTSKDIYIVVIEVFTKFTSCKK